MHDPARQARIRGADIGPKELTASAPQAGGDDGLRLRAARACVVLFASFSVVSYFYGVVTGHFNGDFYGVPVAIPEWLAFLNLLATLAGFVVLWMIYRFYRRRPPPAVIPVPVRFLGIFVPLLLVWSIAITLAFGVGVLGQSLYTAPGPLTPVIQVINRINPFYIGVLHVLVAPPRSRSARLTIVLLIVLGISRAGLGVFLYLGLALLLRHHQAIRGFVSRRKLPLLVVLAIFPFMVSALYDLRGSLRQEVDSDVVMSVSDIVFARLIGRLSSLSNSALILQRSGYFVENASRLQTSYFPQQAFAGIFGVQFLPEVTPERLLVNIDGGELLDVSFMAGTQGNLIVAGIKSPMAFLIVLVSLLVLVCLTFSVAARLGMSLSLEYALILLIYPVISGVGGEYSTVMFSIVVIAALFVAANAAARAIAGGPTRSAPGFRQAAGLDPH